MEKKDLVFLAVAVALVLALAFIAKPALWGDAFPDFPFPPSSVPITPTMSPVSPTPGPAHMVKFAVLSGNRSGTTETIEIPFEYWEMAYTAESETNGTIQENPVFPRLKIQVVDAEDPSRVVRNLEPDLLDARIQSPYDPRPWRERIAEGYHQYYFVVDVQEVQSYQIEILIPQEA